MVCTVSALYDEYFVMGDENASVQWTNWLFEPFLRCSEIHVVGNGYKMLTRKLNRILLTRH